MANVYTKGGDKGTTGLFGGSRTLKNDLRVDAYGTMDEAESQIGFARSIISDEKIKEILLHTQERMFILQAELASDERGVKRLENLICEDDITTLEETIDYYLDLIGEQFSFVRPGENPSSAALHVARTVVRRAERRIIDLDQAMGCVRPVVLKFVNRLSDLLYVLARVEDYYKLTDDIRELARQILEKRQAGPETDDPGAVSILLLAKRMAQASRVKAHELGVKICFSAVDTGGNLVYFERQEDSLLVSIDVSQRKAYTANALKMPTSELAELTVEGGPLYDLQISDGGLVVFGGGYPVEVDGKIIGAIGVSGGTAEEDMQIALAGLSVLED